MKYTQRVRVPTYSAFFFTHSLLYYANWTTINVAINFSLTHVCFEMTSHRSKSWKKDDQASSLTMEAISELLDQHRQALANDFKASFNQLENKFDQVHSTVDEHGQRLSSLELATEDLSQRVSELENVFSSLRESISKLTAKVTDLEGCSRRRNIRILGLAESIEGGRPTAFFSNLPCKVFGTETSPISA